MSPSVELLPDIVQRHAPYEAALHFGLGMAANARSFYLIANTFVPGTLLDHCGRHETQQGTPEARGHVVRTTVN